MNRPLYEAACKDPAERPPGGHPGLWFERFFDRFDTDWQLGHASAKSGWIDTVAGEAHGEQPALRDATDRQSRLAEALHGRWQDFKSDWRFVTGLGLAHPVENGFLWHPTLGVPYLPGAAVKGLVRAWLSQWEAASAERLLDWFGSDASGNPKRSRPGGFNFFDALPVEPVKLVRDVMTPHMGKWYEQGGEIEDPAQQPEAVPADWHDPVPIPFLVADGPQLRFAIAPRDPARRAELDQVMAALADALDWLGAGAKTAAGYGHMRDPSASRTTIPSENTLWSGATVTYDPSGGGRITVKCSGETAIENLGTLKDSLSEGVVSKLKKYKHKGFKADVEVEAKGNQRLILGIHLAEDGKA